MNNEFYNQENEILDVSSTEIESKTVEIEYRPKHYLNAILIYFATMYIFSSIIQTLLIGIYGIIYDLPKTFINADGVEEYTTHFMDFVNLWTQIVVYAAIFVVLILLLRKVFAYDLIRTKKNIKQTLKKAGLGIILVYVASYASNILLMLLNISQDSENQDAIVSMLGSSNVFAVVLYCVVLIVLAPIVEELIFRKAMFGYLKKFNLKSKHRIIITGLLFGGIHVVTAIISMIATNSGIVEILTEIALGIPYCLMGIVLGYIYSESDENVIVPTIVHMFNNGISVIANLILINLPQ